MSFPNTCLKGIPNSNFLVEDGSVGSHLFYFKEEHTRDDGWIEQSINWEDDDSVVEFTLNQKREDGELQFKAGVAIVPRGEIDRLNKQPTVGNILSYERQALKNNPYHGNILLRANVPKPTKRKIAAGLALAVSRVIPHTGIEYSRSSVTGNPLKPSCGPQANLRICPRQDKLEAVR